MAGEEAPDSPEALQHSLIRPLHPSRSASPPAILLVQGFGASWLNRRMATKSPARNRTGFTDFRTVRVPGLSSPLPAPKDEWVAMQRRLDGRRIAVEGRDLLGRFLTEAGYRFQTYSEEDVDGQWRLHFFASKVALTYLEQIAGWTCGPGDPIDFDPSDFLAGWSATRD